MAEVRSDIVSLDGFLASTTLEVTEGSDLAQAVETVLVRYQAEAETLMRRLCRVVVTDEVITDREGLLLITRRRPVLSVQAIDPADAYTITKGGLVRLDPAVEPGTLTPPTEWTLSYTAGLDPETTEAVASMIYERATRFAVHEIDKAQGTDSISEEGYTTTLNSTGWTAEEREDLLRLRQRASR